MLCNLSEYSFNGKKILFVCFSLYIFIWYQSIVTQVFQFDPEVDFFHNSSTDSDVSLYIFMTRDMYIHVIENLD